LAISIYVQVCHLHPLDTGKRDWKIVTSVTAVTAAFVIPLGVLRTFGRGAYRCALSADPPNPAPSSTLLFVYFISGFITLYYCYICAIRAAESAIDNASRLFQVQIPIEFTEFTHTPNSSIQASDTELSRQPSAIAIDRLSGDGSVSSTQQVQLRPPLQGFRHADSSSSSGISPRPSSQVDEDDSYPRLNATASSESWRGSIWNRQQLVLDIGPGAMAKSESRGSRNVSIDSKIMAGSTQLDLERHSSGSTGIKSEVVLKVPTHTAGTNSISSRNVILEPISNFPPPPPEKVVFSRSIVFKLLLYALVSAVVWIPLMMEGILLGLGAGFFISPLVENVSVGLSGALWLAAYQINRKATTDVK